MMRCCKSPYSMLFVGLCAGLLVGVGMMVGTIVTMQSKSTSGQDFVLPPELLQATATHGTDKFAMATGQVASDSEGVFFLDYLTGELQCWVINPRNFRFGGYFKQSVLRDLGGAAGARGKNPKYLMVTGQTSFRGNVAAQTVVYVCDANTGNFVCYGIPWNRTAESNGNEQKGNFRVLLKGSARNITLRDQ